MTEQRKQLLRERLQTRVNNQTLDLELYISKALNYFYNFCNREDVPEAADFALMDIALVLIQEDGGMPTQQEVSRIKRGDTEITYKDGGRDDKFLLSSLSDKLVKFKKMRPLRKE